ncbi:Planctomycete cytochrome C [Thalassoglobus neptunius]|uniref:Planctomycete cytochrome C n=1 Tax=Thalassoglobus neptunius TaxID=1938619 RepID=A0A5C5X766_9PLAN|nr:PSD1 and planctomycete cytochrome C domain-containing protein [Thalassoglobus neptunius]TWT58608.1 Planctomycete cytochrome C [Thalassoglobus neptunius]
MVFSARLIPSLALLFGIGISPVLASEEQEVFFESKVRPLLAEHCFECHNDKKQQGGLRLDRREFVFEDGSAGKIVVPENVSESRLWQVLQYDEFDIQMPPKGPLKSEQLEILKRWIDSGAYWPEDAPAEHAESKGKLFFTESGDIDYQRIRESHWAYQPVEMSEVLKAVDAGQKTPIDQILLDKMSEKGLAFSPQASRSKLIRRLSFDLRGLPPTIEEVRQFENDQSSDAYEKLISRFLEDPAYGERWGRHWLDLARYADTKGYVFTQNRFYPYSYTYRDYVINALQQDVPYDDFIREQLAADQLGYEENDPRLAALGFLTIGPRFLNREPDIIDDRIDVVTRGLMGMTLGCARCHDHKFDPLPAADYYSLYGVFASCYEPEIPPLRGELDTAAPGYQEFAEELKKREQAVVDYAHETHAALLAQLCDQVEDYFPEALKKLGLIPEAHELSPEHGTPRAKLVARWQLLLDRKLKENNPVFIPGARMLELVKQNASPEEFQKVAEELAQNPEIPKVVLDELKTDSAHSLMGIVNAYTRVFSSVRDEWKQLQAENPEVGRLPDDGREQVRRILYGPDSLTDLAPSENSPLFERDQRTRLTALRKEVEDWHVTSPNAPARSMVLFDKESLVEPVVFVRGNPGRRGDKVPRRPPHLLNSDPESVYQNSSGRRELADLIVSPDNPLTARVLVNRLWMAHFGTPLVASTSDFGLQTEEPLQRELLDYLAWSLVNQHDWSLKGLHREILSSEAWKQQSIDRPDARQIDPENTFYWRQNRQRLDFEAMRDSMLAVAGRLDRTMGGRPVNLETEPFTNRRTVYGLIDRNNPSGLLRTFDFPTPNSSSPGRTETTVPQQSLFSMNSTFVREMSSSLANRVREEFDNPSDQIRRLVEITLSRSASDDEVALMDSFVQDNSLEVLSQALLMSNEFFFVD